MRIAAQVVLVVVLVLVCGVVWPRLPLGRAFPDVVALVAVYLGLTGWARVAPATLGAIVLGYLADLLMGTPTGSQALVAGVACVLAHVVHRRLLVRGWLVATAFAFFTGLGSGLMTLGLRAYFHAVPGSATGELGLVFGSAALTGLAGPAVFWLCRAIDARFARTTREREVSLEGLSP